jgi:hypothetical protein
VAYATTPGMRIFPAGSCTSCHTFHSCSWRTFAASMECAWALHPQDEIYGVLEGDIHGMGTFQYCPRNIWWTGEPASMRSKDSVRAPLHDRPPHSQLSI